MPTYLVLSQAAGNPVDIRHVTAADRNTAAQKIKAELAQGLGMRDGQRDPIQIALLEVAAYGTITPNEDGCEAGLS